MLVTILTVLAMVAGRLLYGLSLILTFFRVRLG
jgi:hypothetical protein